MPILTKKNRTTWLYELAHIRLPVSVAPFAISRHLGLSRKPVGRQRMYEDMDNNGLIASPALVRYHGYDRIFFMNQALREIVQDDVDICLLTDVGDKRELLQVTRVRLRDHCYERFDEDMSEVVTSGNLNDWPPEQGSLLAKNELEPGYPYCEYEANHLEAFKELYNK